MTGRLEKGSVVFSYYTSGLQFGLIGSKATVARGEVVGGGEVYVVIRWGSRTTDKRVLRRTAERTYTTSREDALLALDAAVLELMQRAEESLVEGKRLRVEIAEQLGPGSAGLEPLPQRDSSRDVTCSDEKNELDPRGERPPDDVLT